MFWNRLFGLPVIDLHMFQTRFLGFHSSSIDVIERSYVIILCCITILHIFHDTAVKLFRIYQDLSLRGVPIHRTKIQWTCRQYQHATYEYNIHKYTDISTISRGQISNMTCKAAFVLFMISSAIVRRRHTKCRSVSGWRTITWRQFQGQDYRMDYLFIWFIAFLYIPNLIETEFNKKN